MTENENNLLEYYERLVQSCVKQCDGVCNLRDKECECVDANVLDHLREFQEYRAIGTVEEFKMLKDHSWTLNEICKDYSAIGTIEECRTAVERMKAMSTNENMITISLYFEVHDADIYGGEGTVGYANTNVDLKVSALGKADIDNYVEAQRQGVAEMCKVDKEKVIVISRTKYEEETADEDEWDDFDDDWSE